MAKSNKGEKRANPLFPEYSFVAKVSHQMRTPIAIIKEGTDLLLDEVPGRLNPSQKKILTICRSNIKRLVGQMDEILEQLYKKVELYETIKGR